MKNYALVFLLILSAFIFHSCNAPGRVYKTVSTDDSISQVPVSVKKKGDLNLFGEMSVYTPSGSEKFSYLLNTDVRYEFNSPFAFAIGGHYAVSEQFALGLKYIGEQDFLEEYTGHNITGTVNYFKNYPSENNKNVYGFDLLGGFQYKTARNYMTVDEYYYDSIPKLYYPFLVSGVFTKDELSYYRIRQNMYRFFVQPSFSVEGKNFHFYTGFLVAFQDQFKISTSLDQQFIEYVKEIDVEDQLSYLYDRRGSFRGEFFFGIAAGPEIARPFMKTTLSFSPDQFQGNSLGFSFGLTSNFTVKKSKRDENVNKDF